MKKKRTKKVIYIFSNLIFASLFLLFIFKFISGQFLLNNYIKEIESKSFVKKTTDFEQILNIRNYILSDIDYKSPLVAKVRPKIGWSPGTILRKKQGLCGEGTRLLFHILAKKGIHSRRVYLHGNNKLHVILEFYFNGKWIVLETINGPGLSFRNTLDSASTGINFLFNTGPYRYHITPTPFAAKYGFINYSYTPFNGLFNSKPFMTEIYVHKPMPFMLNFILESPFLLYSILVFIGLFLINIATIIRIIKKSIN